MPCELAHHIKPRLEDIAPDSIQRHVDTQQAGACSHAVPFLDTTPNQAYTLTSGAERLPLT